MPVNDGIIVDEGVDPTDHVLARIKAAREDAELTWEDLDKELILGPGWVRRFESGESTPDLRILFVLMQKVGLTPAELFADIVVEEDAAPEIIRSFYAEEDGDDLIVHFTYNRHDARYTITDATVDEFEQVLETLRDGLAGLVAPSMEGAEENQIKTRAVATTFLKAVELWPEADPSDLWWFVVYRAYCDPFNHPAEYARLSVEQSWKRTSGWALEEIFVRHYRKALKEHGITIEIADGDRKGELSAKFEVDSRLEADKVDVFLSGPGDEVFGVVHVKASFAERRTDDVPMSQALIAAGYYSPLVTLDCKSKPSEEPVNKGELGDPTERMSAKRKDFEEDGYFSACFSYNSATIPTIDPEKAAAPVINCDFNDPDDDFVKHAVEAWTTFKKSRDIKG